MFTYPLHRKGLGMLFLQCFRLQPSIHFLGLLLAVSFREGSSFCSIRKMVVCLGWGPLNNQPHKHLKYSGYTSCVPIPKNLPRLPNPCDAVPPPTPRLHLWKLFGSNHVQETKLPPSDEETGIETSCQMVPFFCWGGEMNLDFLDL